MRIISGIRRGHTIQGPSGAAGARGTRPTSDMVREAIFNIIGAEVEGRPVLDLFAGTGALGLEALSRGATSATFVERRGQNVALIRRNLAGLRFEGLAEVVAGNAYSWVSDFSRPGDDGPMVALLDPPYREFVESPGKLKALLATLRDRLPPGSTIVAEAGGDPGPHALPEPEAWDVRRYGGTYVAIRALGDEEA